MTTRIAVLGAGSWGTAFAMVLADAGCEVTLWGRRPDVLGCEIGGAVKNVIGLAVSGWVWATTPGRH